VACDNKDTSVAIMKADFYRSHWRAFSVFSSQHRVDNQHNVLMIDVGRTNHLKL